MVTSGVELTNYVVPVGSGPNFSTGPYLRYLDRPNSPIPLYSGLYSAVFPRLGILGYLPPSGDPCYVPPASVTGGSAVSCDGTPHQG